MKTKFILATIIFLSFATFSANAQTRTMNQHHRIRQGVKSGELTKGEAKNLRHDQKEIREEKKEARADGNVTRAERKDIRKDERKESHKIFRKKHNEKEQH